MKGGNKLIIILVCYDKLLLFKAGTFFCNSGKNILQYNYTAPFSSMFLFTSELCMSSYTSVAPPCVPVPVRVFLVFEWVFTGC